MSASNTLREDIRNGCKDASPRCLTKLHRDNRMTSAEGMFKRSGRTGRNGIIVIDSPPWVLVTAFGMPISPLSPHPLSLFLFLAAARVFCVKEFLA